MGYVQDEILFCQRCKREWDARSDDAGSYVCPCMRESIFERKKKLDKAIELITKEFYGNSTRKISKASKRNSRTKV